MKLKMWFDMDGTIADLYAVEGWLDMLIAHNADCYLKARPMVNFSQFARLLHKAQAMGVEIGIVSWSSKENNTEFDEAVEIAKRKWLAKHLPSVEWNTILVLPYGVNKSRAVNASRYDVLFDDEEGNRKAWEGIAVEADGMMEFLRELLNSPYEN